MWETKTVCCQCCKMMPLCWAMLLFCFSVNAEIVAESGGTVTLECSSVGCCSSIEGYAAMYLYKYFKEQEEVLYYYKTGKVTPRQGYKHRIQTNGSLEQNTITISNLTVNDTGLYRCVYKKMKSDEVYCNVYTLLVMGHQLSCPHPAVRLFPIRTEPSEGVVVCKPEELPQPLPSVHTQAPCTLTSEECPLLVLIIIIITTVTITTLVTTIFIVLILPRMKEWISSRRRLPEVSNDSVYEVMTMNGLRPIAAPESLTTKSV